MLPTRYHVAVAALLLAVTFTDMLPVVDGDTSVLCPASVLCCNKNVFPQVTVVKNVPYYQNAFNRRTNSNETLFMDVYRPTALVNVKLPVIVVVHGGGFAPSSTKNDTKYVQECTAFAQRGFLVASVEYRRYGATFPGEDLVLHPAQDVVRAVEAIVANANGPLRADVENIALYGCSAGAIAVLYASAAALGFGTVFPTVVDAVVMGAGGMLDEVPLTLKPCSSIPPMLFVEWYPDLVAQNMTGGSRVAPTVARMAAHGVPTEVISLGAGHCQYFTDTLGDAGQTLIDNAVSWMLRYMTLPNCTLPADPAFTAQPQRCAAA